jgi:hypothetical protein
MSTGSRGCVVCSDRFRVWGLDHLCRVGYDSDRCGAGCDARQRGGHAREIGARVVADNIDAVDAMQHMHSSSDAI